MHSQPLAVKPSDALLQRDSAIAALHEAIRHFVEARKVPPHMLRVCRLRDLFPLRWNMLIKKELNRCIDALDMSFRLVARASAFQAWTLLNAFVPIHDDGVTFRTTNGDEKAKEKGGGGEAGDDEDNDEEDEDDDDGVHDDELAEAGSADDGSEDNDEDAPKLSSFSVNFKSSRVDILQRFLGNVFPRKVPSTSKLQPPRVLMPRVKTSCRILFNSHALTLRVTVPVMCVDEAHQNDDSPLIYWPRIMTKADYERALARDRLLQQ